MSELQNTISPSVKNEATIPAAHSTLGAAALAILLYLALADAAVETFLSHSPLRWIIAGTAAAYLALSVLLWRKFPWATKAAASFLVLFGWMAFAFWRPEGSDSPITLLRQPTSTLLSGATILGILLAGWILARLDFLPWPARAVLVLLALYAVAAFVIGIMAHAPYAALLHGGSLWEKLPFWLQGAFVGAVVLAPIGLIAGMIDWIGPRRNLQSTSWGVQQGIALCMTWVIALVSFVEPPGLGSSFPGNTAELAPAADDTPLLPEPMPSPENPSALETRFEAWQDASPKTRYDLSAKANALSAGVEPAFFFVRENIRYESYSGALRGDEQTFLSRAGNSLDRSLLLASLLKLKGVSTRFAIGRLSRTNAEKLFDRIFEPPRPETGVPAAPPAPAPSAAAFAARVKARGRRDYTAIRAALGKALPVSLSPSREDVLREIEQHVWVQAQVDARWIDLDSSFDDATLGRTYCDADRTLEALPDDVYQHVTVRVTSESLAENQITTETALETTFAAKDLLDRQIFLAHTPAGQAALGGLGGTPQGGNVWAPVLWVDGQYYSGKAIDFSSEGSRSGGAAGLFGGAFASSSPEFVAEWLEFEIAFPDGHRELTRRALVDRAGAAWRKAAPLDPGKLRPLPHNDRGPLATCALHNIWFSAGRHNIAAYSEALAFLIRTQTSAAPDSSLANRDAGSSQASTTGQNPTPAVSSASDHNQVTPPSADQGQTTATGQSPANPPANQGAPAMASFGELVWPLALQNFAFLVWSDHLIVPLVNDSAAIRLYSDSPRILMFSVGLNPDGKGAYTQFDLRRDSIRGVARDSYSAAGVVERKIWFGALEGALEHEAVTRLAVFSGNDPAGVRSTSNLLTSSGARGLRPEDAGRGAALAGNPEIAARLVAALSEGRSLVVPRTSSREGGPGWWEISSSGNTRAVLDADLNGSYLTFQSLSVNAVKPSIVRELRPDLSSVKIDLANPYSPKGGGAQRPGSSGLYIGLVIAVALVTIFLVTMMCINLMDHWRSMAALDQEIALTESQKQGQGNPNSGP